MKVQEAIQYSTWIDMGCGRLLSKLISSHLLLLWGWYELEVEYIMRGLEIISFWRIMTIYLTIKLDFQYVIDSRYVTMFF